MLSDVSMTTIVTLEVTRRAADDVRPREGGSEQQNRRDAQRQEQQLAQPLTTRLLGRLPAQEAHGAEPHLGRGLAPEQVQQDRHGRRQPPEQKHWIKERQRFQSSSVYCLFARGRQIRREREVQAASKCRAARSRFLRRAVRVRTRRTGRGSPSSNRPGERSPEPRGFRPRTRGRETASDARTGTSARPGRARGTRSRPFRGSAGA